MQAIHLRRLILGGMAILMLANGGCLAAAAVAGVAAAGGAAGYVYLKGNVSNDYNADFNTAWTATKYALADLRMPITRENRLDKSGTIESKNAAGETVTLTLEPRVSKVPADGPITRVNVRVGFQGDEKFSDRVLEQIAYRLRPAQAMPTAVTARFQRPASRGQRHRPGRLPNRATPTGPGGTDLPTATEITPRTPRHDDHRSASRAHFRSSPP